METTKFSEFSEDERVLIFEALLHCIESNSGIGFHDYAQDRIEYESAARSAPVTTSEDDETKNSMFQLFRELSHHLV